MLRSVRNKLKFFGSRLHINFAKFAPCFKIEKTEVFKKLDEVILRPDFEGQEIGIQLPTRSSWIIIASS